MAGILLLDDLCPSTDLHIYCICAGHSVDRAPSTSFPQLPERLRQIIHARNSVTSKKIRLSFCDVKEITSGEDEGDVLLFPGMIKYRGLTAGNAESFVEEVVIQGKQWTAQKPEKITDVYVFICAQSMGEDKKISRIIAFVLEGLAKWGLHDVTVCTKYTHMDGEKYNGNVIIYTRAEDRAEHCRFGYMTAADIDAPLDGNGTPPNSNSVLADTQMRAEAQDANNGGQGNTKRGSEGYAKGNAKAKAGNARNGDQGGKEKTSSSPQRTGFVSWLRRRVQIWRALTVISVMAGALLRFSRFRKRKREE